MKIKTVNIIGSGNVATHLAKAISLKVEIKNIFSNHIENAKTLCHLINQGSPIKEIEELDQNVDMNIIALKDDALANIIPYLHKKTPVVHTSGSVSLAIFKGFEKYGILYPLQTFSKSKALDLSTIPFLLEANENVFLNDLKIFCQENLSKNIHFISSEQREKIHLAAVFANNFSTQMMLEAENILKENQLDFQILKELMKESIEKIFDIGPKNALTGPAKRKDKKIIQKQIDLIKDEKQKEIYQLISERIMNQ